jgi:protease I
MTELNGKRVAFLLTDGFEDSKLTSPWEAVPAAGATAVLVSPAEGAVTGKNGHEQKVDVPAGGADAAEFDALVLPGGVVNPDHLRMDAASVTFARHFFAQHKPVGVICRGAWILPEADVLRGRTLTSYPSLQTDLRNAGATGVDEEVVVHGGMVSSRTPDDLAAFTGELVEEIAEGEHRQQTV